MVQVLIVDDEAPLRQTLRSIFEEEGYAVIEAVDGQDGLEMLRTCQSSMIVLLDYLMPRRNGGEVICDVAADPELRDGHAFLMLTAQRGKITADQEQAMKTLSIPVIPKPFDLNALLDTMAQAAESITEVS